MASSEADQGNLAPPRVLRLMYAVHVCPGAQRLHLAGVLIRLKTVTVSGVQSTTIVTIAELVSHKQQSLSSLKWTCNCPVIRWQGESGGEHSAAGLRIHLWVAAKGLSRAQSQFWSFTMHASHPVQPLQCKSGRCASEGATNLNAINCIFCQKANPLQVSMTGTGSS